MHKRNVHNIAENNLNRTKSELDLCILVTHYWNFSKSKGHNSAEYSTRPKFKPNLRILLTHLYTEFQFKMSICNGDNERKLKINGIFLSPRGITLPKVIRPDPNSNSTCVFLWHIYIPNFNSKCQFVMEIMNGNWKLMEFFQVQGALLCRKFFDRTQIRTVPAYSRDKPMYQFRLKISMYDLDNEQKLNPEWRNDGKG